MPAGLTPVPQLPELPEGPFDAPVDRAGLTIPLLRVTPAEGAPYELQCYNPDLLAYEDTAARHRWPMPGQPGFAPFKWLTFLAWTAAKRTGVIDPAAMPWDRFAATTLVVDHLNATPVRPTPPGPEPG